MILLVGLYREASPARRAELVECLRRNLANPHIREVHVFLEEGVDPGACAALADPKVRRVPHGRRLRYADLFSYAAATAAGGATVIVANADIYFDHSLARLAGHELRDKLLCLSRWDVRADGSAALFEHGFSQDAWIFEAPLRAFPCDWPLGLPGCDNRLAHEAAAAGLRLENPSRSIHAYHLHASGVRHYSEPQRVHGAGRGVDATWLGTPWLWAIVPGQGRLDDARAHFGALAREPRTSAVWVDYDCPDGVAAWVRTHHPGARVVTAADGAVGNAADARNRGAARADGDAILCFLDAEVAVEPGFAEAILSCHAPGRFLVPDRQGPGLDTALVCARDAFDRAGGFDDNYTGGGAASADLRAALGRAGLDQRTFPASWIRTRGDTLGAYDRARGPGDPALEATIDLAYRRLKDALIVEIGAVVPRALLRVLRRAVSHHHRARQGLVDEAPCAAVAFREAMGYTVSRLRAGVSSHNNDPRPFGEIPPSLDGLAFTQVVASRVSTVRVEFRTAGKLYLLVGTDWGGYDAATAFLRDRGYREPLPRVRTQRGTDFEVWSLVGESGEAMELPTQVMLVARELVAA